MLYWAVVFLVIAISRGRSGLWGHCCWSVFDRSNSVLHLLGDLPRIAHYGLYDAWPSSPADMTRRDDKVVIA